jgi:glycosyltransferase involved in cell wall biosynthesis
MLKVAAYTSGRNIPSARFRVRQYIPLLRTLDVEIVEHCSRFGSSPPRRKALRPLWGAATVADRILSSAGSYQSDVTLLQREMVSTLCTVEPLTHGPRALDVDDAIWLRRDGSAARRLARLAQVVICGNDYLADHFSQWNDNVRILPTPVDTDRYTPSRMPFEGARRIGWSGESSNFKYLAPILPALRAVMDRHNDVIFRIVSEIRPRIEGIPEDRIEFIQWSPENEVRVLQEMAIGLMPLEDTPWARGKCSYKMLTYMACGVPVVASPVGMNATVLARGGGYGPRRWDDWSDALECLLKNESRAAQMSEQGRRAVADHYSLRALAPRLADILESCRSKN